ncbi:MAG: hypothetical protein QOH47_837 [Sphingomonadales bacterium]|jgi:hypothetical protein|nr:hypothetical protein [Sphingomonadales bacterium]
MTDIQAAPAPAQVAMTPGRYLRLRREAAGLTLQHVAIILVPAGRKTAAEDRAIFRRDVANLEADQLGGGNQVGLVDLLSSIFSFDSAIYWLLVGRAADPDSEVPVPQICRGCGCTWNDACIDGARGCAWSADDPTLCTVCERKESANEA